MSIKSSYKILIVDDEVGITSMLTNYLILEGFNVESCNDPEEALKKIETGEFRILITDIMMPKMTGPELMAKVKDFDGLIQIVAMTGYVTISNILAAFRFGANNVFFKPFENLEVVRNEVEVAIRKLERIHEVIRLRGELKR